MEILHRIDGIAPPRCQEDISRGCYSQQFHPINLREFDHLYEPFELYRRPRENVRGLREFDVLNRFTVHPVCVINTYILIHRDRLRQFAHTEGPGYIRWDSPMLMVPTKKALRFYPFSVKRH